MQPVVFIGRGLFSSLRLWEAVKIAAIYFILYTTGTCLLTHVIRSSSSCPVHAPEGRLFISDPPPPQRLQIAQENLAC